MSNSKKNWQISQMWKRLQVKYPLLLSDFNKTWILLSDFQKKSQISNFTKIRPVAAELFHADRQTDGYKDNSRFS
jgi:hypothetical protein